MDSFKQANESIEYISASLTATRYANHGAEHLVMHQAMKDRANHRLKNLSWWVALGILTAYLTFCAVLTLRLYDKFGGVFKVPFEDWVILYFLWSIFLAAQKRFAKS